jgi:hypothetical protein
LIRNGGFTTPPGVDNSSQILLKSILATREHIKNDTPTESIFATYSDLAFAAATLICQLKARNAPTEFGADQLALMRRALGEWRVLSRNNYCMSPDDCLTKRQNDVKQIRAMEDQIQSSLSHRASEESLTNWSPTNKTRLHKKATGSNWLIAFAAH